MNTYTTYQPTNIAWLGDIPSHWELSIGMTVLKENKRSNKGMKENTVLSLSYGEIIIKDESKLFGLVPECFETYQIVELNDIIIRCTDLQNDKTSLRTGLAKNKGIITSAYLNLGIKQGFNPKFIHYYLHTLDITKVFYGLGSGLRQNLSYLDFKRLPMAIPPLSEQTAIAEFLDKKTAQIQTAIRLKREQIDRLKEYRQALINQTLTQGLNPNAALKNSGVVWLGDIPSHWAIKKFRHLFSFRKGLSITKENLQETGIPCVNYGEIHSKFGFSVNPQINELKCVSEDYLKNNQKSLLTYGDFIFADTSEDIEGSGNFTYLNSQMLTFAGYHTVVCSQKEKHNPRFLAYVFDSSSFRNQIRTKVKGVKVYSITQAILKDNFVWLPPFSEQTAIADYLDSKTTQIDTALATYQAQIDKLNEYQRSLVNDVVTGKIDVRTI